MKVKRKFSSLLLYVHIFRDENSLTLTSHRTISEKGKCELCMYVILKNKMSWDYLKTRRGQQMCDSHQAVFNQQWAKSSCAHNLTGSTGLWELNENRYTMLIYQILDQIIKYLETSGEVQKPWPTRLSSWWKATCPECHTNILTRI